jgi:hypothetical protein
MPERRTHPAKRAQFENEWADLRKRLQHVCSDVPPDELRRLTREMTRRKLRWDSGMIVAQFYPESDALGG